MYIFAVVVLTGREGLANSICRNEVFLVVVLVMVVVLVRFRCCDV